MDLNRVLLGENRVLGLLLNVFVVLNQIYICPHVYHPILIIDVIGNKLNIDHQLSHDIETLNKDEIYLNLERYISHLFTSYI